MFFFILVFLLTLFWIISFLQALELWQNNVGFLKKKKKEKQSLLFHKN